MLHWTWTTFFLEIRILFSTVAVMIFFYKVHMLDSLLKPYFEGAISRRNKLRVEFGDFSVDLWNGKGFVKNAIMYHPTLEEDPRWYFEYMSFAESIIFTFDPLKALYGFFTNKRKLLVFDTIMVQGIDLFVEGYEEEGKKTVLNLKLIGGEIPRRIRRRKPTQLELRQAEKEREKSERENEKARKAATAAVSKHDPVSLHGVTVATASLPATLSSPPRPLSTHSQKLGSGHKDSMPEKSGLPIVQAVAVTPTTTQATSASKSSWGSTASLFKQSISSKLHEWHSEVKYHGLVNTVKEKTSQALQATVNTVDAVYKTAKRKIGNEFATRVDMLHEKLRGGEPIAFDHEFLIQAKAIIFLDIEVTLRHALPPSLRQFEKRDEWCRPLRVPMVSLHDITTASSIVIPLNQMANGSTTVTAENVTIPPDIAVMTGMSTEIPYNRSYASTSTSIPSNSLKDTEPRHHHKHHQHHAPISSSTHVSYVDEASQVLTEDPESKEIGTCRLARQDISSRGRNQSASSDPPSTSSLITAALKQATADSSLNAISVSNVVLSPDKQYSSKPSQHSQETRSPDNKIQRIPSVGDEASMGLDTCWTNVDSDTENDTDNDSAMDSKHEREYDIDAVLSEGSHVGREVDIDDVLGGGSHVGREVDIDAVLGGGSSDGREVDIDAVLGGGSHVGQEVDIDAVLNGDSKSTRMSQTSHHDTACDSHPAKRELAVIPLLSLVSDAREVSQSVDGVVSAVTETNAPHMDDTEVKQSATCDTSIEESNIDINSGDVLIALDELYPSLLDGTLFRKISADVVLALSKELLLRCQQRLIKLSQYMSEIQSTDFQGVPLCVVIYKLERLLLYELLRGNSGRLLQDAILDITVGSNSAQSHHDIDSTVSLSEASPLQERGTEGSWQHSPVVITNTSSKILLGGGSGGDSSSVSQGESSAKKVSSSPPTSSSHPLFSINI